MGNLNEINQSLTAVEEELAKLDAHRSELLKQITELQKEKASLLQSPQPRLPFASLPVVTNRSPQAAKIAFFRSLFRGREDVYAKRFVSLKTGRCLN